MKTDQPPKADGVGADGTLWSPVSTSSGLVDASPKQKKRSAVSTVPAAYDRAAARRCTEVPSERLPGRLLPSTARPTS
jgi:hypothetical protein